MHGLPSIPASSPTIFSPASPITPPTTTTIYSANPSPSSSNDTASLYSVQTTHSSTSMTALLRHPVSSVKARFGRSTSPSSSSEKQGLGKEPAKEEKKTQLKKQDKSARQSLTETYAIIASMK